MEDNNDPNQQSILNRLNSGEVLVSDDGSTDNTTNLVRGFAKQTPQISLLSINHGGKGWAVGAGMLRASGEYRFLCDADLSMPISSICNNSKAT